ncbi:MAG: homoserine kinase [Candidatus Dormibacteria bacterium]
MRARIAVPATVANLGPGFDVLALALQLQNEVEAELTDEPGLSLELPPGSPPELRDPDHNLVVSAYRSTCEELDVPSVGVRLRCVNRIPLRRGLGSSAAAALGGTLAACALHAADWDENRILAHVGAIEGHPDNAAAALLGGLAICPSGAPAVRLDVPESLLAVLFVPEVELATRAARAVLPATVDRADAVFNAGRCALLVRALILDDPDGLRIAMEDRLHQDARTPLFPALPALIGAALSAGACGAALAGAGPSVLALVHGHPEEVQRALAAEARSQGVRGRTLVSGVRNWGARIDVIA